MKWYWWKSKNTKRIEKLEAQIRELTEQVAALQPNRTFTWAFPNTSMTIPTIYSTAQTWTTGTTPADDSPKS